MRKLVKFFLATLAIFTLNANAENIAIIKNIKGKVLIKKNNNISDASLGETLEKNDIVMTKKDSSVDIYFDEGSVLSLGEDSFLNINEFVFKPLENDFKFDLTLSKGTAAFTSGKIGKLAPESFKMHFPEGVVGIRGTKFVLKVK